MSRSPETPDGRRPMQLHTTNHPSSFLDTAPTPSHRGGGSSSGGGDASNMIPVHVINRATAHAASTSAADDVGGGGELIPVHRTSGVDKKSSNSAVAPTILSPTSADGMQTISTLQGTAGGGSLVSPRPVGPLDLHVETPESAASIKSTISEPGTPMARNLRFICFVLSIFHVVFSRCHVIFSPHLSCHFCPNISCHFFPYLSCHFFSRAVM
eukprot:gnl/Spiro4/24270_TR12046_c0_g1_i1.p1 gnl/Spiro4/24270_TR12046_c0_g1~~gnl/Spiro4/24270_TR12046_c0_g1_i1.p1  ORF type:complete len:212 (-),score=15.51 gnl/Spiro4/24270_TR12046_c0_g1_i1:33-668(-)